MTNTPNNNKLTTGLEKEAISPANASAPSTSSSAGYTRLT
jgi:hypothetical protein